MTQKLYERFLSQRKFVARKTRTIDKMRDVLNVAYQIDFVLYLSTNLNGLMSSQI